jgi:hypothetical protein
VKRFKCLWNLCKFDTDDRKVFIKHIDYHAYHTRLKTFGLGLANIISIPQCHNDEKSRNNIPSEISDYVCYWSGCGESYLKFHYYLEHVNYHLTFDYETETTSSRGNPLKRQNIRVKCKWDGCGRSLLGIFELRRHMRTHTKEKMIGCAHCGTLFGTKPLYIKHCIRQVVNREIHEIVA